MSIQTLGLPAPCKPGCLVCNKSVNSKHKPRCVLCEKIAHPNCVGITQKQAQSIIANSLPWYCSVCCAPCGICNGNVLNDHHAVQCDRCDKWLHTACCNIDDLTYSSLMSSDCNWFCPMCDAMNFSDSFFSDGATPSGVPDLDHVTPTVNSSTQTSRVRKTKPKLRDRIKIVLTNCQSVVSKAGDIAILLDTIKPDFICGTESWLDPSINSAEIFS